MAASSPTLDLRSCDREPVQLIGATQAFGFLVITDRQFKIVAASANYPGGVPLGEDGGTLLGLPRGPVPAEFSGPLGEVAAYALGDCWYFEVEPKGAADPAERSRAARAAMEALDQPSSWRGLLAEAAVQVRALTGYDRVMIYRFHPDLHGEVVAEATRPGVDSFLGLHYPASDIPAPARKVFYENWVRLIADVNAIPQPLVSQQAPTDFDLSRTLLRSASPIHLEYLRNMGVGASLTVSLRSEGKLWGLIACHHLTPRYLGPAERAACELIGRFVSAGLRDAAKVEELEHRNRMQGVYGSILQRLKKTRDIGQELLHHSPTILDLIRADGSAAALYVNGAWECVGKTPGEHELDKLVDWLSTEHAEEDVFATDELPALYAGCHGYRGIASGLLALNIPKTTKTYVLLFRPEKVELVRWAGRPTEKEVDATGRLHPRRSFSEWRESVRDRSEPWTSWELEAAHSLRSAILGADLHRQFEKEQIARQDAERAMRSREELMAVLSHDLKNPIGSITLQAAMMERIFTKNNDARSLELAKRIQRATSNMSSLINDILHVTSLEAGHLTMEKEKEDLYDIARETADLLEPLAANNHIALHFDPQTKGCHAPVDRERILQVLSNLVGNAIKFTPSGGSITLRLDRCGPEEAQFSILDTGPGIPEENHLYVFDRFWQANQAKRLGTGLGLAICKGIVEAHGGRIWVENREGGGTAFHFTLPL